MKQTKAFFSSHLHLLYLGLVVMLFIVACAKDNSPLEPTLVNEPEVEQRQQWRPGDYWSPCEAANLTLFVDPCFLDPARADALQALNDAVDAYNNAPGVGINITMVFDETNPNIDITIECDDNKIETQGANGCVNETGGDFIAIDTNGPGGAGCPFNVCYMTNTVMHEMGHILGFGHANLVINGNTVPDGITIAGTQVENQNCACSIMLAGDCNSQICQFSAGDIVALQTYYPDCACDPFDLEGPDILCINEVGEYCIQGLEESDQVIWSIQAPFFGTIIPGSTNQTCWSGAQIIPGTYTLTVNITRGDCEYTASKTYYVYPEEYCGKRCYCVCLVEDPWTNIDYCYTEIDCNNQDCSEMESCKNNYYIEECWIEVQ